MRHRSLALVFVLLALAAPAAAGPIRLSTEGSATLGTPPLSINSGSVAEVATSSGAATLYFSDANFDGNENVDALHVLPNGHIVLSTTTDAIIGSPPLAFENGDLIEYDPTSNTATILFAEAGRFTTQEDIDAVYIRPNGHIVLSTEDAATLAGVTFSDGDLVEYDPIAQTAVVIFAETSFVGDEDIDAVHILPNGHLVISVERDTGATLGGLTFTDGDVVEYDPIADTATILFAESQFAHDEDVDAIDLGCGNGAVETDEECDGAGESAGCNANCTLADCGDGLINASAGETCDHQGESPTCDANCTGVSCGDGTHNQTAGEGCDDAGESATCDADCTPAVCGDGTHNQTAGEDCDDTGESATCDDDCTAVTCGDTTLNQTAGESCDDGNVVNGDCCAASCLVEAADSPCPGDTNPCTTVDRCDGAGSCEHLAEPDSSCRAPIASGKSIVKLSRGATPDKNGLFWKWTNGAATTVADFGAPATTTDYDLCIYDDAGLLSRASAPAGGTCGGNPCWRTTSKGFKYADKDATPDGIVKMLLQAGADGAAKIIVKGKGANLDVPTLPIALGDLPVTVQLRNGDGVCWDATFASDIKKNVSSQFKAKSD